MATPVKEEQADEEFVTLTPARPQLDPEFAAEVRLSPALLSAEVDVEAAKRRQSLAFHTPLPEPPTTGFKDRVAEKRFSTMTPSASHPALLAPRDPDAEGPSTPMDDLRRRLDSVRLGTLPRSATTGSLGGQNRRNTVGFILPSSPSERPTPKAATSYTVIDSSRYRKPVSPAPKTPIVAPHASSGISSLEQKPARIHPTPTVPRSILKPPHSTVRLADVLPPSADVMREAQRSIDEAKHSIAASPSSPSFSGLRDMLRVPMLPKTPWMGGLRAMFATPPTPSSPNLDGMAEMYQDEVTMEDEEEQESVEEYIAEGPEIMGTSSLLIKEIPARGEIVEEEEEIKPKRGNTKRAPTKKAVPARTASRRMKAETPDDEEAVETIESPEPVQAHKGKGKSVTTELAVQVTVSKTSRPRKKIVEAETKVEPKPRGRPRKAVTAPPAAEPEAPADEPKPRAKSTSSRSARPKTDKILSDSIDQSVSPPADALEPAPKSRSKASTKLGSSASTSTKSRSVRTEMDKENEPEVVEEKPAARKRAPAKVKAEPVAAATGARTTRNRK